MKFIPRRRANGSVINLTPLIDCMFLLVIFIMIAARFEPDGGIPVNLPKGRSSEARKAENIELTVTVDGKFYIGKELIAPENLERAIIAARTAAGDPAGERLVLVVYGDKDASHGRVVEALDAAARAKQRMVTIRTRQ